MVQSILGRPADLGPQLRPSLQSRPSDLMVPEILLHPLDPMVPEILLHPLDPMVQLRPEHPGFPVILEFPDFLGPPWDRLDPWLRQHPLRRSNQ